MQKMAYETAVKKAQLVERNPGVGIVDPMRVSKHDEIDIISLAEQIQNAHKLLKNSTSQKLVIILEQIRMLQAQAMEILKESEENDMLHRAACNFIKKPGQIYHLYQRSTGQNYFSMLSPEEWRSSSVDQKYLGSYRLEFDQTWTPLSKIKEQDEKLQWAERCIASATNSSMPMAIDFNINDKST